MGAKAGIALKSLQWFIRGIEFCCAGLVLAVYSYFLATLHNHNLAIATWIRAVEGISGAATLYTLLGLLLLCCLAGFPLTSFLAIVLDIAFAGAFIYVAVANRHGAGSCTGTVDTVFGTGDSNSNVVDDGHGGFTELPSFHTACKLETASFAVSIIAIIFFLLSAAVEFGLARNHQKEKRFGPSPRNNYTSGSGRRRGPLGWFSRRGRGVDDGNELTANVLPAHATPDQVRASYATESTAVGGPTKYGDSPYAPLGNSHGKYGSDNPYGEPAQYPAGNYRYEDGVYSPRQV